MFIDAGAVEVSRDEAVAYASAILAAGGEAELRAWGAFHGCYDLAPERLSPERVSPRRNPGWNGCSPDMNEIPELPRQRAGVTLVIPNDTTTTKHRSRYDHH
ncbi:hypothetical protein [Amycolatopsis sp. cmx-11-51]|uniref:hypothetical protein n=1 Tax=Amycolatopsis sp. cmx-11-51 TaxID=2785797 RepID=UPI0039E703D3